MGMVFSILKKYRVAAIAALVMMLIELTVELIQPLLISKIIDDGIQKQDLSVVWMWGAVLTGSAIIAFIAGISSSFLRRIRVRDSAMICVISCMKRCSPSPIRFLTGLLPHH